MKRKFLSYIHSFLNLLDNGKFYRKPFGWMYAAIAVVFLLTPVFMVYSTIWWNNAYQNKLDSEKMYKEVLLPKYQKIKYSNDTLSRVVETYGKEMNNAIDCLTKATKQADYYGEYASYGPDYQQIYSNALDVKSQWDVAYKEASERWDVANAELDVLKARFNKVKKLHDKALSDYQEDAQEFDLVNQFGTVFSLSELNKGHAIAAMVLFTLMVLLVGILNFLLWWSRLLGLKSLIKVQDKFVVTPVASHFIQTVGESLGLTISLWGFFTALIFYTCHLAIAQLGVNFTDFGAVSLVLPIVFGFLIAFVFRILAELLKAVVVLANNNRD